MSYDPFGKPIHELELSDLTVLLEDEVAEGYWIEHKSAFPENRKVAKSVASFANTYGGWLFIGVSADTLRSAPTRISGFELKSVPDPVGKLREIVKSHIDPVPVFYTKVIDLDEDKAVLVVHIPETQETPFITSDGRIYRRVGDSSDPVSENNRYAVDRLYEDGRHLAQQFDAFCEDERAFSQAEKGGWVKVYLSPRPLGILQGVFDDLRSSEDLEKLLALSRTEITASTPTMDVYMTGSLPFDHGRLTNRSVILRQTNPGSVTTNPVAVEFFLDGQAKFFLPLQYLPFADPQGFSQVKSQKAKHALLAISEEEVYLLEHFDARRLWEGMAVLVSYYETWLTQVYGAHLQYLTGFKAKLILDQVWRHVAFLDSERWGDYVMKLGLPVVDRDTLSVSMDIPERRLELGSQKNTMWFPLACSALTEFGLPIDLVVAVGTHGADGHESMTG